MTYKNINKLDLYTKIPADFVTSKQNTLRVLGECAALIYSGNRLFEGTVTTPENVKILSPASKRFMTNISLECELVNEGSSRNRSICVVIDHGSRVLSPLVHNNKCC